LGYIDLASCYVTGSLIGDEPTYIPAILIAFFIPPIPTNPTYPTSPNTYNTLPLLFTILKLLYE